MALQSKQDSDTIRSRIVDLIAKQRLSRLVEGAKFPKYTPKGQRVKDRYWMCRLSPNHRTLHYGDIEENRKPQVDELPNKISVTDIKRLLIGKDGSKKTSTDLCFTVVYESDHEDNLNFVCSDQKTFCHWIDGLSVLLKLSMNSEEFRRDLQILTRIEQKILHIYDDF